MNKLVVNCESGETQEIELSEEEINQREIDKAEEATLKAKVEAKALARQAILDRLGLTEEEAKLLLG